MSLNNLARPTLPGALLAASRRLLRPLVRLMMNNGITFPVLADELRGLFVDVAVSEMLTQPRARTDSRISLVTGIHRKDIRRLRDTPPGSTAAPEKVTVASQIIARWLGSEPFADAANQPRPLPRIGEAAGAGPSFDALVSSVTTDVRSRAVLDDWLSRGLVRLEPPDHVVLNVDAFIPRAGEADQMFYFARNLHDHLAAATANISAAGAAPFLERSVHYDELTPQQAQELEAYARETAARVLREVNRKALALVETAKAPQEPPRHRVNFGVFVFGGSDAFASVHPNPADGAVR